MEKTMGRDKRVALRRQEAYPSCRENTTQFHCKLCQRAAHGQLRWHKRNNSQVCHKPVPQRLILLRPTGRHLRGSHFPINRAIKQRRPSTSRYKRTSRRINRVGIKQKLERTNDWSHNTSNTTDCGQNHSYYTHNGRFRK